MANPRHRALRSRRLLVARRVLIGFCVLTVIATTAVVIAYRKLEGNINTIAVDELGERPEVINDGPQAPMNVLVMGSDTREGENSNIGGDTPGLSDTTILLHLSADRTRAYGVSLPRDAMVERPVCPSRDDDGEISGGLTMFNAAYAVGGPLCTVKTVEALTDVRVDHFVVLDFVGFRSMVDALGGVEICVPEEVNDTVGKIQLPEGTYNVTGQQALDYVRVRHALGAPNGDIGRMRRQQAFIAAMIQKVMSAGTLANPARLYGFLNAATKSLTTNEAFADLRQMASLGSSLQSIGLDNIQFITVPFEEYPADPNRLQWSADAEDLWNKVRKDKPLGRFAEGALSAAQDSKGKVTPSAKPSPSKGAKPTPSQSATADPSSDASESPTAEASPGSEDPAVQARKEAGLCT